MKKLSVFMALCIILSSCTKTVDVPAPEVKYTVPVEIETRSEGMDIGFNLKKGTTVVGGEFYFNAPEDSGYTQNAESFKKSREVDLVLNDWDGADPNEERILLGSAVIHIKFNKGTEVDKDITGTGTWTSNQGEGTMTNYISEGEGVLTYKYNFFPEEEDAHPVETVLFKGLMNK